MFIGCPDDNFRHPIESLGGVRIVTNYIRTNKFPGRSRGNSNEDLLERIEAKASVASFISVSHRYESVHRDCFKLQLELEAWCGLPVPRA